MGAYFLSLAATVVAMVCVASPVSSLSIQPLVEEEVVMWQHKGDGDVDFYRTPLVTPAPDGSLVAVSAGHKLNRMDADSKFLSVRRSIDGGMNWQPTDFIIDDGTTTDGLNPGVIITDHVTKTMMILYGHCLHTCHQPILYMVKSHDNGVSWGKPVDLSKQIGYFVFAPGPGYGIQKRYPPHEGRLIACGHGSMARDGVLCIYSDDHGRIWKTGAEIVGIPYNARKAVGDLCPDENQLVELNTGSILITIRNECKYHARARLLARSHDGGETASLKELSIAENLVEPACAGSMLYVENYDVLFHSNPLNDKYRVNMTLSWSYDHGYTWNVLDRLQVWPGPSGYSCLTAVPGKPHHIGLMFEQGKRGGKPIEFVTYVLINLRPQHV